MQICPSCKAANEPGEEVCFKCGRGLTPITEGSLVAGRYEIQSRLGRGGMGVVYRARDQELDEIVALKVLRSDAASPEMSKRFRAEIKLARRVTHPNVCRIHEFGRDGNVAFIIMEYVEGSDFKHILAELGRLPPAEAYAVAIQIAEALQAIHDQGIVHRDLKTPNIMRDIRGVVKLMDFGIAKSFEGAASAATATGHVVGTPEYMSPEQARGAKLDGRSDIYALGIVVFELFTGDVPFRGDTPVATLFLHIETQPPLAGVWLPASLAPILAKALAKAPHDRFQTAREFALALRQASGLTPSAPAVVPAPAPASAQTRVTETTPIPAPGPSAPAPAARSAERPQRQVPVEAAPSTRPLAPRSPTAGARRALAGVGAVILLGGIAVVGASFLLAPAREAPTGSAAVAPARPELSVASPLPQAEAHTPASIETVPSRPPAPDPRPAPPAPSTETPTPRPSSTFAPASPPPETQAPAPKPSPRTPPATAPPATLAAAPLTDPTVPPADVRPGTLQVVVVPWAEVEIDGAKVGVSPPLKPLSLPAGVHAVRLTHPDYQPLPRKVTIRPGETTRLQVDLAKDAFPR